MNTIASERFEPSGPEFECNKKFSKNKYYWMSSTKKKQKIKNCIESRKQKRKEARKAARYETE